MPTSSCTEVRPVPWCFDTLVLGTVADSDTAHYIYLKNLATGRDRRYAVTSSGTTLQIDVANDGVKVSPGEWYEVRSTLASATDITTNKDITISGTDYSCLLVRFTEVYDSSREQSEYTSITLKL